MTREQKISALAEEYADRIQHTLEAADARARSFKAGVLAGIALRDAELLEKLKFNENEAYMNRHKYVPDKEHCEFYMGALWKHEQFIKAIKGSSCDQGRLESDNVATGTKGDG